LQLLLL